MSELPWEEIVNRLKKQDNTVINNLYKSVFPKLRRYVVRNKGNLQSAEDVFQDAMLVIYNKAHDPTFTVKSSVTHYVYAVGKYIWLKKLKKNSKIEGTFSVEEALIGVEGSEVISTEDERLVFVEEKIRLLKEECRKLLAYYFEGYSMKEIAEKMKYGTNDYARKRKYKCKQELMEFIKADARYRELLDDE